MVTSFESTQPLLKDVALYILESGGKRIRPTLIFLCAKTLGSINQEHIKAAMCLELIHNATLLHDDIIDESALRRGKKVANKIWSASHSILAGDFMLCHALEILSSLRNWEVMQLIQKASRLLIEGQALELQESTLPIDAQENHYLQIIRMKTASLFEASAALPATMKNLRKEIPHFQGLGRHIGISFQLIDDVLDYQGDPKKIGKNPGQDFMEGKITLPLIYAYQKSTESEKEYIDHAFRQSTKNNEIFQTVRGFIASKKGFEETVKLAKKHIKLAENDLRKIPDHPIKEKIQSLMLFIQNQIIL